MSTAATWPTDWVHIQVAVSEESPRIAEYAVVVLPRKQGNFSDRSILDLPLD